MRTNKTPTFSQIVCGSQGVRTAFQLHGATGRWWMIILKLHGKPVDPVLSPDGRTRRIADGFRFYASLYRLLAVVFFLVCPALIAVGTVDQSRAWHYWAGAGLFAGAYLWNVSGLGYAGARSYAAGNAESTSSLVAFMVMIVAFLSMFVAAASIVLPHASPAEAVPNLIAAGLLFALGIGSYMIEIIYLATERSSAAA